MSTFKRGDVWYVEFIYKGHRVKRSAGRTAGRAEARALERQLRNEIDAGLRNAARHTFDEALEKWLNGEAKGLRDHGLASHIRRVLPHVAGKYLDEGVEAAEAMRAELLAAGKAPATINRRLAVIRRLLALARQWRWTPENYAELIPLEAVDNARKFYITPEQVEALASACTLTEAGRMIRAAAACGLRRGELFRLIADDVVVDGKHRWVVVRTSKNGEGRKVPIQPSKHPLFLDLPFKISPQLLRKQWDQARKECGLTHLHFHDLRHAYGTQLSGVGANVFVIASLMGHRDHRMSNRYVQKPDDQLLAIARKLDAGGSAKSGRRRKPPRTSPAQHQSPPTSSGSST